MGIIDSQGRCIIVGAGDFFGLAVEIRENDFLIAADGGLSALSHIGAEPDLIIGDFDSYSGVPRGRSVVTLPIIKDVTDMHAAAEKGMERGYREFHFFGGIGGRLDHTLANIQLLSGLSLRGCFGYIYGKSEILTVLRNGSLLFPSGMEGGLSIFSLSDTSVGVSLSGLKYELRGGSLENSFALGVSNSFTGEKSKIEVEEGVLLIYWEFDYGKGPVLPERG